VRFSKQLKSLVSDHPLKPRCLAIDTVGITNGCVDTVTGMAGWLQFAYNNTYGVHFASEAQYKAAMHNLTKPDGCLDLIQQCRELGEAGDPDFSGGNATVNKVCMQAWGYCAEDIISSFPKMQKVSYPKIILPKHKKADWACSETRSTSPPWANLALFGCQFPLTSARFRSRKTSGYL
jgi:hypothetical protein